MSRIFTAHDARAERVAQDADLQARYPDAPARLVARDPRIGELWREGRQVFYAYAGGAYIEGDLAEVEAALARFAANP